MRRRLLVTGFGPFPSMPRNPSAALARHVAGLPRWRLAGVEARALVMTTAYGALARELDPALAERPDAVLMIGVAGRARRVRVESRATARRSTLFPDVAGAVAARPGASGGGPRRTAVPPIRALRALAARQVPCRHSRDAGRYLCNAAYFRALGSGLPVLFVHVPKPGIPRPGPRSRLAPVSARLGAALGDIAAILLSVARRGR